MTNPQPTTSPSLPTQLHCLGLELVSSHSLRNRSKHGMQQILNHLLAALVAGLLDLADARLGFGVGFVLGGLVSLCVLCVVVC